MSWLDHAESQLAAHANTLHAIEAIAKLVKKALVDPGTDTFAVIQVIEKIADTLIAGFGRKVDAAEVRKQLAVLTEKLLSNDEAADKALDDKFGH
jgi:hypothetical protein